jgi:hypothetical protein
MVRISLSDILNLTRKELYQIARELKIKGRSRMRKGELLEAIKKELELLKEISEEDIGYSFIEEKVEKSFPEGFTKEEELKLPEYKLNFLRVIPVNPETLFIYWNTVSSGKAELQVLIEDETVGKVEVELSWHSYYFKLPEESGFKRAKAILRSRELFLESPPITLPSEKVHLSRAEGSNLKEQENLEEFIRGIKELQKEKIIGYGERK